MKHVMLKTLEPTPGKRLDNRVLLFLLSQRNPFMTHVMLKTLEPTLVNVSTTVCVRFFSPNVIRPCPAPFYPRTAPPCTAFITHTQSSADSAATRSAANATTGRQSGTSSLNCWHASEPAGGYRQPTEMSNPQRASGPSAERVPVPGHGKRAAEGETPLVTTNSNASNTQSACTETAAAAVGGVGYRSRKAYGRVAGDGEHNGRDFVVDRWLGKMPQSVWQPNTVVRRHRSKANLYWTMLLIGYAVYIALVSG